MTRAHLEYLDGWAYAARLVAAGIGEAQLASMCASMLRRGVDDRARGFCAGVLSGYHEIAESHRVVTLLGRGN